MNNADVIAPKTPRGFHAFLLADIHVEDSGTGAYVDVVFRDGKRVRARASAEALRLGSHLRGLHRATLHFRTDEDGLLVEPLHLYRLRTPDAPLESQTGTYWSAIGLASGNATRLAVYPERAKTTPFQIVFVVDQAQQAKLQSTGAFHAQGFIRANQLVAVSIERAGDLPVPERWARRARMP